MDDEVEDGGTLFWLGLLADRGLRAISVVRLPEVAEECTRAAEYGDSRFSVLARAFSDLFSWWAEHEEYGGVPSALARAIDQEIVENLPEVLDEDLEEGRRLAIALATRLRSLQTGPDQWFS